MHPMKREPEPTCLAQNAQSWTNEWVANVGQGTNALRWQWRSQTCYNAIRDSLMTSTDSHCSYCDTQPLTTAAIDHFVSKMKYPQLAYEWHNLFAVCNGCNQAKGDRDPGRCLRPDETITRSSATFCVKSMARSFRTRPLRRKTPNEPWRLLSF
jgi:5-methylcytosine-specific restriction endonuclease McrA